MYAIVEVGGKQHRVEVDREHACLRESFGETPREPAWATRDVDGHEFVSEEVRHGAMINYVGFVPTDEEMKESWSAPGDPQVLRGEFEGWDPRIVSVLAPCAAFFSRRSRSRRYTV